MGAPSSGLIAEIFLQHVEHLHLARLVQNYKLLPIYIDAILLTFDPNHTNIQTILNYFNAIHPKLQFTAEKERYKTQKYLDFSIHRTPTGVKTSIYRKPTFTHTIIPYTSNHPTQHKYATVKFLFNRLNTYDLCMYVRME